MNRTELDLNEMENVSAGCVWDEFLGFLEFLTGGHNNPAHTFL